MIDQRHRAEQLAQEEPREDREDSLEGMRPTPGKVAATTRLRRDAVADPRAPQDLRAVLRAAARGGGAPLPAALLEQLERALRADLSRVRIHTDEAATRAAEAVGARAFAFGEDVFFAAGQYDPSSSAGQRLIAHEVAHTVQAPGATVALEHAEISGPGDHDEVEAHAFADAFATRWNLQPVRRAVADADAAPAPARPGSGQPAGATIHRDAAPAATAPAAGGAAPGGLTADQQVQLDAALHQADSGAQRGQAGVAGSDGATATAAGAADSAHAAAGASTPAPSAQARPATTPAPSGGGRSAGGGGGGSAAPGLAGGGGGTAPAPAPAGGALAVRPTDGLVDYYMETHWDSTAFYAALDTNGPPQHLPSVITEIDAWMPPGTDPQTRSVVNLICGVGLGAIDGLFWAAFTSTPVIGIIGTAVHGLQSALSTASSYLEVGDYLGLGVALFRVFVDTCGGIADNVASTAGLVATACEVGAAACGVIAGICALTGVGLPVAAALATAAVEMLEVALEAKEIQIVAQEISLGCTALKIFLDMILLLNNALGARDAEARGDFEAAGRYKTMLLGNVTDTISDTLSFVVNGIGLMMSAAPGTEGLESAEQIALTGFKTAGREGLAEGLNLARSAMGHIPAAGQSATHVAIDLARTGGGIVSGTSQVATAGAPGVGDAASGAAGFNGADDHGQSGMQDLLTHVPIPGMGGTTMADEMRTSSAYVDPARAHAANALLHGAQDATVAQLHAAQEGVTPNPQWYQTLINEIIERPHGASDIAGDLANGMNPSTIILQGLRGIRGLTGYLQGGSLDAIANGLDTAAGWANTLIRPAITWLNAAIADIRPHLQEMLESINGRIQAMQLNLTTWQSMVAQAQSGLGQVQSVTQANGVIDQKYNQVQAFLRSMLVTRARLHIPASCSIPGVDGRIDAMIAAINAPVQAVMRAAERIKTNIIQRVQTWVTAAIAKIQAKVAEIQALISQGGAVHDALQNGLRSFQSLSQRATTAFAQWDGKVPNIDLTGAGAWLRSVAASARRAHQIQAGARPDPWLTVTLPAAQREVDTWKATHGANVATLFTPTVSAGEITACTTVYNDARPHAVGPQQAELDAAYAACMAFNGRTGRAAIYGLWEAEERLGTSAAAVHTGGAASGGSAGAAAARGAAEDASAQAGAASGSSGGGGGGSAAAPATGGAGASASGGGAPAAGGAAAADGGGGAAAANGGGGGGAAAANGGGGAPAAGGAAANGGGGASPAADAGGGAAPSGAASNGGAASAPAGAPAADPGAGAAGAGGAAPANGGAGAASGGGAGGGATAPPNKS